MFNTDNFEKPYQSNLYLPKQMKRMINNIEDDEEDDEDDNEDSIDQIVPDMSTPTVQLIPKAKEIKEFLDQYVVGQEEAKRVLSVAVHNHYIRINSKLNNDQNVEIQRSNILMIGPSGSGKTLLAQSIAKILNIPFVSVDATSFTPTGIVGKNVENIINDLLKAANGDIKKAENGIVYIDEIDKLASSSEASNTRPNGVLGHSTQSSFLKLLEGEEITTVSNNSMFSNSITINTKNILFICGGAFAGIENIAKSDNYHKPVGFNANVTDKEIKVENSYNKVGTEDVIRYGLMPEIVGRLPVFIKLKQLTTSDFAHILTQPKNAILKQYQKLFEIENINLTFSDDAVELIANMAIKRKVGARGLKGIVEQVMTNIMFEIPSDGIKRRCHITPEIIQSNMFS